jgi:hypothetical protein
MNSIVLKLVAAAVMATQADAVKVFASLQAGAHFNYNQQVDDVIQQGHLIS